MRAAAQADQSEYARAEDFILGPAKPHKARPLSPYQEIHSERE